MPVSYNRSVGEIRRRERNGRVTYLARHYGPTGRKVSKSFERRKDAADWLALTESSKLTGTYVDPHRAKIKAGAWADEWLKGQGHLKLGTRTKYEGIVTKHVKPRWGTTPINKVSHSEVQAWVSDIKLAPGSVRYIHRVLYLIMELAIRDGRIAHNPAAGVKLPRLPQNDKRFLTRDQVWALADCAAAYPIPEVGGQYRVMILLLAYTGLRWGECSGLKVKRVDLMRRRLMVAETLTEVRGHLHTSTPKNHAARQVPFPPFLADELVPLLHTKQPDDYVFTTWRGKPLRNLNFRRDVFDKAAADAGLDGLTPHELRHTAASLAVSAGANVKAVQAMLGHASATMTLDTYSHLFDDDLDGVAERMGTWQAPSPAEAEVLRFPKRPD
jgi:integrase